MLGQVSAVPDLIGPDGKEITVPTLVQAKGKVHVNAQGLWVSVHECWADRAMRQAQNHVPV